MKNKLLILLAVTFCLSACSDRLSLLKRRYNKGYYVSVKRDAKPVAKVAKERSESARTPVATRTPETNIARATEIKREAQLLSPAQTIKALPSPVTPVIKQKVPVVTTHNDAGSRALTFRENLYIKALKSLPAAKAEPDSDVMLVLLVILAIFIPPLAVYLKDKAISKWFWLTLILCLLSLFAGWWFFPGLGLLWLAAVVIALLYVFDVIK
jgi:uncharacterized membrane protein YqaE (UPF0057 family)